MAKFASCTAACLLAWTAVCSAQTLPAQADWTLRLPQEELVLFKGQVNYDDAGTAGGAMLYPAPGLAGMLAAIATHAVIVNSVRSGKKTEIELAADKVLLPYKDTLSGFRTSELMQQALAATPLGHGRKTIPFGAKHDTDWVLESMPVFSMTQDQSALVLDHTILLHKPGSKPEVAYQNTVRVVSTAVEQPDAPAYWQADQGRALKAHSAQLMAISLDMALQQASSADNSSPGNFRTFRYREGKKEVVERAQLLSELCNRSIIKNLRGWLISIPTSNCPAPEIKPVSE